LKRPLHLTCDCSADCMTVDLVIGEDDFLGEGYISFSSWWSQNQPWRRRIKLAWLALRGKEHYFSEVILHPEQVEELKEYINE